MQGPEAIAPWGPKAVDDFVLRIVRYALHKRYCWCRICSFGYRPEILGYAYSSLRDSKFIDFPPVVGRMEAIEVTKMIGQKRVKYGVTDSVSEEG